MSKHQTDEMKLNEIIIANLPEEISIENKLKRFREIDKNFIDKDGTQRYFLLRPYNRETIFVTLFIKLDRVSAVFKYIEKYLGKVRLIDTDFDEEFQGKIDFWVGEEVYSLVSADDFTIDAKKEI